ncbi:MAG: lysophospholipid acyltransferase family protein [Actinomycetota bacterium]
MRTSRLYLAVKAISGPLFRRLYRIRVEGTDHLPLTGPVIVAANHVSFADSLFLPLSCPRPMVFLAHEYLFKDWRIAWFFKTIGMIPVGQRGRARGQAALEAGLKVLAAGGVLGVYPEGTRSPDGALYRGHTGVARFALASRAPVVPVGLIGCREVWPRSARWPKLRGRVTVVFGKPLHLPHHLDKPVDPALLRAVTYEIMSEVRSLSGQDYVDRYATNEHRGGARR